METGKDIKRFLFPGSAALLLLVFLILTAVRPPVLALNDDLQLQSILSGAYTGTPDYHTVYMRAPLSFVIALFYRIFPQIPWFGLFYCGCTILASLCVLYGFLKKAGDMERRFLSPLRILFLFWILFLLAILPYILPHYTTLAAFVGGAGLFLLVLSAEAEKKRSLRVMAILLLLLCDQIRSQVFYLLCPFLMIVVIRNLCQTGPVSELRKDRDRQKKMMRAGLCFLAPYFILLALDACAYGSPEWKFYRELNKARTELYDYTLVWETENAKAYYTALGMEDYAYPLYLNYDLLPERETNAERLFAMADYEEPSRAVTAVQHFRNVLYELRVRTVSLDGDDNPLNYTYLILFLIMFVPEAARAVKSVRSRQDTAVFLIRRSLLLIAIFLLHYGIYGWLLWRGRVPERVVTSLYMTEILLLFGLWLCRESRPADRKGLRILCAAGSAGVLLCAIYSGILQGQQKERAYRQQIAVNLSDDVLYSYLNAHPDELFLADTYTAVYRTGDVLAQGQPRRENIMLLGGWLYGSPLQRQMQGNYGFASRDDLFTEGGIYFVRRQDRGITAEELQHYLLMAYGSSSVQLELVTILKSDDACFEIYRFLRMKDPIPDGC